MEAEKEEKKQDPEEEKAYERKNLNIYMAEQDDDDHQPQEDLETEEDLVKREL